MTEFHIRITDERVQKGRVLFMTKRQYSGGEYYFEKLPKDIQRHLFEKMKVVDCTPTTMTVRPTIGTKLKRWWSELTGNAPTQDTDRSNRDDK